MIVIKPDGKLKVWRKASEKWRPECLGYIANVSSSNIKIMVWGCLTYYGVGTLALAIYIRQGSSPETELTNLYVEFDFYASNPQIHGTYDKEHCHLGSTMYC
jgi:hypothetical protein